MQSNALPAAADFLAHRDFCKLQLVRRAHPGCYGLPVCLRALGCQRDLPGRGHVSAVFGTDPNSRRAAAQRACAPRLVACRKAAMRPIAQASTAVGLGSSARPGARRKRPTPVPLMVSRTSIRCDIDRPNRSEDHTAIMSNSRRIASLSNASNCGRLSRPLAPETLSSNVATTCDQH